jgi:hypothetical protein
MAVYWKLYWVRYHRTILRSLGICGYTKILLQRKKEESKVRSRTGENAISLRDRETPGPRKAEVGSPRPAPVIASGLVLIRRIFDLLDAGSGKFDITPLCKCQGESFLKHLIMCLLVP